VNRERRHDETEPQLAVALVSGADGPLVIYGV